MMNLPEIFVRPYVMRNVCNKLNVRILPAIVSKVRKTGLARGLARMINVERKIRKSVMAIERLENFARPSVQRTASVGMIPTIVSKTIKTGLARGFSEKVYATLRIQKMATYLHPTFVHLDV
jgi:hypothetical protein